MAEIVGNTDMGLDEYLAQLREVEALATPAPWDLGRHQGDPAAFLAECAGKADAREVWMAIVPGHDPDDSRIPAITGNGPTSEINARLIVAMRNVLPMLLADRERRPEAERIRFYVEAAAAGLERIKALEATIRDALIVTQDDSFDADQRLAAVIMVLDWVVTGTLERPATTQ